MKILKLIPLITLSACAPTVVMLHNPETREIVKCAGDPWGAPAKEARICAQGYEKMGYKRIETDK